MENTMEIVMKNVHEVLDKYLCGELMRDIENEIRHGIEYDLANSEVE
jgi:hypothetical protein